MDNDNFFITQKSFLLFGKIFSLEDETPSTKEAVWKLWSQIGKKWVEDEATRDDKMKEQLDFQGASEPPTHFPTESNLYQNSKQSFSTGYVNDF